MINTITPLKVILNPPARLEAFSGESVTLHISLINQGDRGATIDVFIDSVAREILPWCPSPRKRVALDSQQACEVSLFFEIPITALPGSYSYTVVVDAPEHYPEETPIHYSGSLEVLVKEQTAVRSQKPTFSLYPATSPTQPLLIEPNQHQSLSVIANNHSSRVDRFRLHCLDLDKTMNSTQNFGVHSAGISSFLLDTAKPKKKLGDSTSMKTLQTTVSLLRNWRRHLRLRSNAV